MNKEPVSFVVRLCNPLSNCYLQGHSDERIGTVQKMIIGLMHSQARRLSGDDDDDGFVRKVVTW